MSIVSDITPEIEASAGGVGSSLGTGGMFTKIQAAKAATSSGIHLAIARGDEKYAIARILQGENIGTVFVSKENRLQFRKRWLAFGARIMGKLVIDEAVPRPCVKPAAAVFYRQESRQLKDSLKREIPSALSIWQGTNWPAG